MIHDSTWPAITRATRWLRLLAPVGFLLTCVLLAALPAVASATTPEMRGEWELTVTSPGGTAKGVALISTEANGKGEFAASSVLFSGVIHGTFSGTIEGSTASVLATAQAYGPAPASEFTATNLTVESSGPVSISGKGTLKSGANTLEATFVATRIKTYKEVEEREAKEKQEQEEREARENIRGEWELVVSSVAGQTKGTALITEDANSKNEFASSSALVEHLFPGSFSGTLEGAKASVTVIAQTTPTAEFTSKAMTVESHSGAFSMSGSGTLKAGENTLPATLVATRIKTYTQLKEAEAKEKQEQEAKAKAEQEAKEKAEQEAKAKAEQEAKAKAEQEAKVKAEQEAKAKAEREAKEKAEREAIEKHAKEVGSTVTLLSAEPTTKTITAAASGALSLGLSNPNSVSVQGHVTMTATVTGKTAKASATAHKKSKTKTLSLGSASFTISAHANETVKISLSHSGRTELARLKTLRILLTIVTDTSGKPNVSKVYTLTLRAAAPAHRRR